MSTAVAYGAGTEAGGQGQIHVQDSNRVLTLRVPIIHPHWSELHCFR